VDPAWANLPDDEVVDDGAPAFVKELVRPSMLSLVTS
jgi:pyruvate-ferredoxin/flavodoxin oxidoreductase